MLEMTKAKAIDILRQKSHAAVSAALTEVVPSRRAWILKQAYVMTCLEGDLSEDHPGAVHSAFVYGSDLSDSDRDAIPADIWKWIVAQEDA